VHVRCKARRGERLGDASNAPERPGALHGGTAESHSVRGLGSAGDALKAEVRERRSDALGGTPGTPRGLSAVYSAAACRAVL
jgi:hypothetical protein